MNSPITISTMTGATAREAAVDSLINSILQAITMIKDNVRANRIRNDLRQLDDHMLTDIGLTRFDVESGNFALAKLSRLSAKGHPENI